MIAESYERIHRSNLIGMGIVPLQYLDGESTDSLNLSGKEIYDIKLPENIVPGMILPVTVSYSLKSKINFFLI